MGIIETLIVILAILFLIGLAMHLLLWLTWPLLILAVILLIIKFFRKLVRKISSSPSGK